MTQINPEDTTTKAGGKKLTLRKETLRDLTARNSQTQQVKGELSPPTNTGDQCSFKVSGCA